MVWLSQEGSPSGALASVLRTVADEQVITRSVWRRPEPPLAIRSFSEPCVSTGRNRFFGTSRGQARCCLGSQGPTDR